MLRTIQFRALFLLMSNLGMLTLKYRVSIKSFPDYKPSLQENDVEYKHI
jgi:hypothetical protein